MKRVILGSVVALIVAASGSYAACGTNQMVVGKVTWIYQNATTYGGLCFQITGCTDTYVLPETDKNIQNQMLSLVIMAKTNGYSINVNYNATAHSGTTNVYDVLGIQFLN